MSSIPNSRGNIEVAILQMIKGFIKDYRKIAILDANGVDNNRNNIFRDVNRQVEASTILYDRLKRGEDIGLNESPEWTKDLILERTEESCHNILEMAFHDKDYFDGLVSSLAKALRKNTILPPDFNSFIADVAEKKLARPKRVCPTRSNYLRDNLWGLILYVLEKELGIKPTANDTTRDGSVYLISGCDFIAEVWDESTISYTTVRDTNTLKKHKSNPDKFPYANTFLKYWQRKARILMVSVKIKFLLSITSYHQDLLTKN